MNHSLIRTVASKACKLSAILLFFLSCLTSQAPAKDTVPTDHLADCTVLIIRHAEKPESGTGLTAAGQQRAEKYIKYFEPFSDGKKSFNVDSLMATANTARSHRPVLTLTPLSASTGLPIDQRFSEYDTEALVNSLHNEPHGKHILIAWHHGKIKELVKALGGQPESLFGEYETWPHDVFDWVFELEYDRTGKLKSAKRIKEDF